MAGTAEQKRAIQKKNEAKTRTDLFTEIADLKRENKALTGDRTRLQRMVDVHMPIIEGKFDKLLEQLPKPRTKKEAKFLQYVAGRASKRWEATNDKNTKKFLDHMHEEAINRVILIYNRDGVLTDPYGGA